MKELEKEFKLSKAQEQILHDQVIDLTQPGPILRDFQILVDAVAPQGLKAAGKYNLLPIDMIDELDQRLSRPLHLPLQRPQLRSHPYLQGLHLLLRASGLSRIEGTGSKARLVVDPAVLERWRGLNPTEQYFHLLEAWLLVGRPEMVGEPRAGWGHETLPACLQAWKFLPAEGKPFKTDPQSRAYFLGIGRDVYHLALMDLFGLVEVEQRPRPVAPWCPAAVQHLPFGDSVFTVLARWYFATWGEDILDEQEATRAKAFGAWQVLFQPYFPEWQNNLVLPKIAARKGTFVFRVSLGDIWRRIAMPANAMLGDLVDWILRSVHFDYDHLYEFTYRDRFGAEVCALHPAMDEGPSADEVRIGELPLEPGQSMRLTYDFGDNWKFDVKLERIEPPGARIKAPRIMEKQGKAPPQYSRWD